jgi:hypothetical protein
MERSCSGSYSSRIKTSHIKTGQIISIEYHIIPMFYSNYFDEYHTVPMDAHPSRENKRKQPGRPDRNGHEDGKLVLGGTPLRMLSWHI